MLEGILSTACPSSRAASAAFGSGSAIVARWSCRVGLGFSESASLRITIIALLAGISLVVGFRVTQSGKANATRNVLKSLDQVLEAYVAAKENALPPAYTKVRMSDLTGNQGADSFVTLAMFDGRFLQRSVAAQSRFDRDADPAQPSAAVFLLEARQVPECEALIKGMDVRFLERRRVPLWGWNDQGDFSEMGNFTIPVPLDAFGQPLRMGHPAFFGGAGNYFDASNQVPRPNLIMAPPSKAGVVYISADGTRSFQPFAPGSAGSKAVGDSDEGVGVGKRPYFYSGGIDQNPGTRDDNVYTNQPTYPSDTRNIRNN